MARVICSQCNGTGKINDPEENCPQCRGIGEYETDWVGVLRQLEPKIDSIIAEQAAQRIDLTASLTAIWNKVKDL